MKIKIAARKSDLARLQAYRVGEALQKAHPDLEVEYLFSTSLGDQNQNDPLWQMPEKGVFTEDLTKKLLAGDCDLVVHSWKDLPTEPRVETIIAATLPRADARDMILFRKAALGDIQKSGVLRVFSSSPRRILSVAEFLSWSLPFRARCEFSTVRGNMITRVRKLMEGGADALVLAKAALDRLLTSHEAEFQPARDFLREALSGCLWMVLPHCECPGAPAQGALAVEARSDRADLLSLLGSINCVATMANVERERAILQSYGGGCHQKIGIIRLSRWFGDVEFLRGETPGGERIDAVNLYGPQVKIDNVPPGEMFPLSMAESPFYKRVPRKVDLNLVRDRDLWVARADALPAEYDPPYTQTVWVSGLRTWRKLAERGIWVNGSQESLGEGEVLSIESILGRPTNFLKLSHSETEGVSQQELLETYDLVDLSEVPDLAGKTHFFWASYSNFKRALARYPQIRGAVHACGPGNTYTLLRQELGATANLNVFLSYEAWLRACGVSLES